MGKLKKDEDYKIGLFEAMENLCHLMYKNQMELLLFCDKNNSEHDLFLGLGSRTLTKIDFTI